MNHLKAGKAMMAVLLSSAVLNASFIFPAFAMDEETVVQDEQNTEQAADQIELYETETAQTPAEEPAKEAEKEKTDPAAEAPVEKAETESAAPLKEAPAASEAAREEQKTEPAAPAKEEAAPAADTEPAGAGTVEMNGVTYDDVQDAVEAAPDGAVINVNGDQTVQASIPAGKTLTINVAPGVTWKNSDSQGHWEGSVITNRGNLTLNNQGSLIAHAAISQSFAIYNLQGGVMTVNGGTYTSEHGDYIIANTGSMTIQGNAQILKPHAGSQTAVINGFRYGPSATDKPAQMHIVSATVEAPQGIALKNDDLGIMVIDGGSFSGNVCAIQNINEPTINGGDFTGMNSRGYVIYNQYASDVYGQAKLTIHNANFYASQGTTTTEITYTGNAQLAKNNTKIYGGSYYADQPGVSEQLVAPRKLHEHDGRYLVEIPVSSIALRGKAAIQEDEETTITAALTPSDASHQEVTWTLSNPDAAEIVSQDKGTVTLKGLKPGKVTLTASAWDASVTMEITVKAAPVAVTLTPAKAELKPKETLQLTAAITPSSAKDKELVWTSPDPKIASVDEKGLVTAVTPGKPTITVSVKGETASASAEITVSEEEKNPAKPGTPAKPSKPAVKPTKPAKPAADKKHPATSASMNLFGSAAAAAATSTALLASVLRDRKKNR